MPVYTVGIMTDKRQVEAPSAEAAALFYGVYGTNGNGQLMATVYEVDGQPYEGDQMPWAQYMLEGDALYDEFMAELHRVKPFVEQCRFVDRETAEEDT